MTDKMKPSFVQQAARASWVIPLATLGLMAFSNASQTSKSPLGGMITGGTFILLLLSGLIVGIIGCFGIKRHGVKTTLIPGIIGILLNSLFLVLLFSIAVPAFHRARARALQQRNQNSNRVGGGS